MKELRDLIARNLAGSGEAMPSVCSAHPDVVAASVLLAEEWDVPLLIEATSNQVNQFGGYTGMRPADFIAFVNGVCVAHGVDPSRVRFGGDHLGPQAWRNEPAESAMAKARTLVAAYVSAGFTKIHLDCSEGCLGEPAQVGDMVSAARAAELARVCEDAARNPDALSYMFGTEVPPPGGARVEQGEAAITPTAPASARATIEAHRAAFAGLGLGDSAWRRAVGLVVQPGLEFAPDHVHRFDLATSDQLSPVLAGHQGLAFEAHSTDYQLPAVYPDLAERHFAVLKVGPALTYAYRQAIYALDAVAGWAAAASDRTTVSDVMEALMLEAPGNWTKHYQGDEDRLRLLRHFSYADRIRYYWTQTRAQAAVDALLGSLKSRDMPRPLLEQYFAAPVLARAETLGQSTPDKARALIYAQIQEALVPYFACYGRAA
ncbi:class II D-tagatose-bisphosphate aldolase, non-catalytic subunit [Rhizobium sp. TH2]|uniref:class II D-tagatose-bisphosphate aldolase, non-catalytic subunit n=1 Tax=Rhizobium sp. TH2 TaxID=2775403 RepID=UPI002157C1DD|nr:class II D-tagatose-bisphosphate aldolase, non-catalytic subunit [Rhizobium sp. TH2]UVC09460.1 class II D-tagatose-bisphosphate aldolase, non-catalytic subunit [Rhizobium sp. TH2]